MPGLRQAAFSLLTEMKREDMCGDMYVGRVCWYPRVEMRPAKGLAPFAEFVIEQLGGRGITITSEGLRYLATRVAFAPQFDGLLSLSLSSDGIGDAGVAHLCSGLLETGSGGRGSRLTSLNLTQNYISDAGAASLAAVLMSKHGSTLRTLVLCDNHIGDAGCASLAAGLRFASPRTSLDLTCHDDTDITAMDLLCLRKNKFGSAGALPLAEAVALPSHYRAVRRIELEGNFREREKGIDTIGGPQMLATAAMKKALRARSLACVCADVECDLLSQNDRLEVVRLREWTAHRAGIRVATGPDVASLRTLMLKTPNESNLLLQTLPREWTFAGAGDRCQCPVVGDPADGSACLLCGALREHLAEMADGRRPAALVSDRDWQDMRTLFEARLDLELIPWEDEGDDTGEQKHGAGDEKDGEPFLDDASGRYYSVNAASGATAWLRTATGSNVYHDDGTGQRYKHNPATGATAWLSAETEEENGQPAAAEEQSADAVLSPTMPVVALDQLRTFFECHSASSLDRLSRRGGPAAPAGWFPPGFPDEWDYARPEQYLTDADFARAFGERLTRHQFLTCTRPWRQAQMRMQAGLTPSAEAGPRAREWGTARADLSNAMIVAPGTRVGWTANALPSPSYTTAWRQYKSGLSSAPAFECWACADARGVKQSQCGVCFQEGAPVRARGADKGGT